MLAAALNGHYDSRGKNLARMSVAGRVAHGCSARLHAADQTIALYIFAAVPAEGQAVRLAAEKGGRGLAMIPAPVSELARSVACHGGIAPTRWSRIENDAYFTLDAHWIVPALLSKVKIVGPVLEPAAGVGHLVRELRRGHGLEVIASDLHAYEGALVPDIGVRDIWAINSLKGFKWVITNLPYRDQDRLARAWSRSAPEMAAASLC